METCILHPVQVIMDYVTDVDDGSGALSPFPIVLGQFTTPKPPLYLHSRTRPCEILFTQAYSNATLLISYHTRAKRLNLC